MNSTNLISGINRSLPIEFRPLTSDKVAVNDVVHRFRGILYKKKKISRNLRIQRKCSDLGHNPLLRGFTGRRFL